MKTIRLGIAVGVLTWLAPQMLLAQQTLYSPRGSSEYDQVRAQAALVRELADNQQRAKEIQARRQRGVVETLHQVEAAAVPMPDDPPIRYPSPTAWQELTARRRAAYGSAGAARRSPAEEQIEQALRSPVEVQFDQVPLAKAVAELKDLAGVEMQLDELAIYAAGIAPDTPVSVRLRGISLKSVLNLMLRDLGLTHVVENEMILITSQQAARTKTQIRVYYVGDLLRR